MDLKSLPKKENEKSQVFYKKKSSMDVIASGGRDDSALRDSTDENSKAVTAKNV